MSVWQLPDCEVIDNEEDPLTFQLQHKNPFTHPRYPITFKAHGPQSKPAWVECIQEFKEDSGNFPPYKFNFNSKLR